MIIEIYCRGTAKIVRDNIHGLLLKASYGAPLAAGIEYDMDGGYAYTFTKNTDGDFYKILQSTGLLSLKAPGEEPGSLNLLTVPKLRAGLVLWNVNVYAFIAYTDDRVPIFLSMQAEDKILYAHYGENDFNKLLGCIH